jgi:dihydrofolate reductase
MYEKVMEIKKRYTEITSRSEILKLEEEIKVLMGSETFETIPDDQKDALDELLLKVINKKEYFHSGLDPWKLKH